MERGGRLFHGEDFLKTLLECRKLISPSEVTHESVRLHTAKTSSSSSVITSFDSKQDSISSSASDVRKAKKTQRR